MICPRSGQPVPLRESRAVVPCLCGRRAATEPDPSGWGGAVLAEHETLATAIDRSWESIEATVESVEP